MPQCALFFPMKPLIMLDRVEYQRGHCGIHCQHGARELEPCGHCVPFEDQWWPFVV